MKRLLMIFIALAFVNVALGQNGKIGTSVSIVGSTSPEALAKIKAAGIEYIEVTMNSFWRNKPENEVYIRAYEALKNIDDAGLKVSNRSATS